MFTMNVETSEGVKQHPFHLGTVKRVAENFVMEQLKKPEVKSVALYDDKKLIHIYDWRDIDYLTRQLDLYN